MNITKAHISIGTLITVIPLVAGAVMWYDGLQAKAHDTITAQQVAANVELDLQRVELELKLLRTIEERRELTPDEQDRLDYLKQLREVLIEQQRKQA